MLDFANEQTTTFFDLSAIKDTSAMDRLNMIRELHNRLASTIHDQQLSVETTRSLVYR